MFKKLFDAASDLFSTSAQAEEVKKSEEEKVKLKQATWEEITGLHKDVVKSDTEKKVWNLHDEISGEITESWKVNTNSEVAELTREDILEELIDVINRIPNKNQQERQKMFNKIHDKNLSLDILKTSLWALKDSTEYTLFEKPVEDGALLNLETEVSQEAQKNTENNEAISKTEEQKNIQQVVPDIQEAPAKKVRIIPLIPTDSTETPVPTIETQVATIEPIDADQSPATWNPAVPTPAVRDEAALEPVDTEQSPATWNPAVPTQDARKEVETLEKVETSWEEESQESETDKIESTEQRQEIPQEVKNIEHTVKPGQSLWRIVEEYFPELKTPSAINAKIDEIVRDNNIENRDELLKWQKLKISWAESVNTQRESKENTTKQYEVVSWDNLWKIVQKHYPELKTPAAINAKIDEIVSENNIKDKNAIFVGQSISLSQ